MSVVLRRNVLSYGDLCLYNLSGSHCQSGKTSAQVVETSVTTTNDSPSHDYTHADNQTTVSHVTPRFKPFTISKLCSTLTVEYSCKY